MQRLIILVALAGLAIMLSAIGAQAARAQIGTDVNQRHVNRLFDKVATKFDDPFFFEVGLVQQRAQLRVTIQNR